MNPAWGRMLGMWIDNKHPALAGFPTDNYNDWQWTEIVRGARAVNLDHLPSDLQPIVQPIDDWNRNYKLGLVFEAKVGNGKLMVASADLETDLNNRIVARQLRRSLLDYMASPGFDPKVAVTPGADRNAFLRHADNETSRSDSNCRRRRGKRDRRRPEYFLDRGRPASCGDGRIRN